MIILVPIILAHLAACSTLGTSVYIGMGWVQNGHLYLRYGIMNIVAKTLAFNKSLQFWNQGQKIDICIAVNEADSSSKLILSE